MYFRFENRCWNLETSTQSWPKLAKPEKKILEVATTQFCCSTDKLEVNCLIPPSVCLCVLCTHRRTYTWMNRSRLISLYHLNLLWSTSPSYAIRMNSLNWHLSKLSHTHTQQTWCTHKHMNIGERRHVQGDYDDMKYRQIYQSTIQVVGCANVCLRMSYTTVSCKLYVRAFHSMIKLSSFSLLRLLVFDFLFPSKTFDCAAFFSLLLFKRLFLLVRSVRFLRPNFSGVDAVVVHTQSTNTHIHTVFPIDLNVIINGIEHSATLQPPLPLFFPVFPFVRSQRCDCDGRRTAAAVVDGTLAMACFRRCTSISSRACRRRSRMEFGWTQWIVKYFYINIDFDFIYVLPNHILEIRWTIIFPPSISIFRARTISCFVSRFPKWS